MRSPLLSAVTTLNEALIAETEILKLARRSLGFTTDVPFQQEPRSIAADVIVASTLGWSHAKEAAARAEQLLAKQSPIVTVLPRK
jgi:hypothetical protein